MADGDLLPSAAGRAGPLTCRVVAGVRETDRAFWERALPGDAEGYAYHAACEAAGRGAFALSAAVVSAGDRTIAACPLFSVVYRLDTALQGTARKVSDRIARFAPKFGQMKLLGLGSPYADACALAIDPALDDAGVRAAVSTLIEGVAAHGAQSGAALIAVKDLPDARAGVIGDALRSARFARMNSLPIAALHLPFTTVDEYLASLSSSTRKDIRRKLKSAGAVSVERRVGISDIQGEIRSLYEETRGASAFDYGDFETLPETYFESIAAELGDRAVFILYRIDGKLAAFNLLFKGGDRVIDKFLGMRKGVAQEHNLYAVSWIENVRYCLENNIKTLQSGQTAYTLKLRLGSELEGSGIWFRHKGRVVNGLLRAGAPLVAFDKLDPDLAAWRRKQAEHARQAQTLQAQAQRAKPLAKLTKPDADQKPAGSKVQAAGTTKREE
jgi:Peptidogalycan biosysnthesis/recognition